MGELMTMKKKIIATVMIMTLLTASICSCGKKHHHDRSGDDSKPSELVQVEVSVAESEDPQFTAEEWLAMQPQEIQIRNICQLATLEVYFHNVAKAEKPVASGLSGTGQQPRRFWFEYSGSARVGIDMSQVTITITNDTVYVQIPHASIIGNPSIDSDSYSFDSIVVESDSSWGINPNNITAADLTSAVSDANLETREELSNDSGLMLRAETRAVELIEAYVDQISAYSNVEYNFEWSYIETE